MSVWLRRKREKARGGFDLFTVPLLSLLMMACWGIALVIGPLLSLLSRLFG